MSNKYFEAKIWLKSKRGENDYSMFINEQPKGGFKWEFLDYEPKDKENYSMLIVHNFTISDLESIQSQLSDLQEKYDRAVELMRTFYLPIGDQEDDRDEFLKSIKQKEVQFESCGKCLCKCACEEEENE